MDIRVVDLIKLTEGPLLPKEEQGERDNINTFICLGHFDIIQVRNLLVNQDAPNTFADIWNDYRQRKSEYQKKQYIYPLYIIHSDDSEKLDLFWEKKFPCLMVSRVHFDIVADELSPQDRLKKALNSNPYFEIQPSEPNCNDVDISISFRGEEIHCVFYQTMELGDIAVIIKCNSLNVGLEVSQTIEKYKNVGDIYSYCGLQKNLFDEHVSYGEFYSKEEEVHKALHNQIPYVGMRFSIHSVLFSNLLFNKLGCLDKVRFVTGTADTLIEFTNEISCMDLVEIIKILDGDYEYNSTAKRYTHYHAFDDIITRVGLQYNADPAYSKTANEIFSSKIHDSDGQKEVLNQLQKIKEIVERQETKDHAPNNWIVALTEQVHLLITLMNNCVMDDLSLLIWPGVRAFIMRLYELSQQLDVFTPEYISEIEEFLDSWLILSNDIVHLESQLVQNPKLQAPRVYVPSALLAYYMALLDQFNELLLSMEKGYDGKDRQQISYIPLIAHNIQQRANTICILDPSRCQDGRKYTGACPLVVSMPVDLMYYPEQMSAVLCHEFAHYSGNCARHRDIRFKKILRTCCGLLLNMWRLDGRKDGISIPLIQGKNAIDYLTQVISEKVKQKNNEIKYYIDHMREGLFSIVSGIYLARDTWASVLTNYCDSTVLEKDFVGYYKQFTPIAQQQAVKELEASLSSLLLLYHECYADVMVNLCLGLTKEKYLTNMYEREISLNDPQSSILRIQKLAFQAALVCHAVNFDHSSPEFNNAQSKNSHEYVEFLKAVDYYMNQLQFSQISRDNDISSYTSNDILFIQAEYIPLVEYLKECATSVTRKLKSIPCAIEERNKLVKMFQTVESDVNINQLRQDVDKYHYKLSNGGLFKS